MRAIGFLFATGAMTLSSPTHAARVSDHADLTVDIDSAGATVCHFSDTGPVDDRACSAAEKLTFSGLKQLEPNAFAALVLHYPSYQASITVTKAAPQRAITQTDLAGYRQAMQNKMAGTRMQIAEAPRLVQGQNGLPIVVSAIRNPEVDVVTRTLEVRARNATYRVLFSVAAAHAAEVANLAERTAKTVVARPATTRE
jgi:hypothetical protein